MVYYKPRRRWGRIIVLIILVLMAGTAVAGYLYFRDAEDARTKEASQPVVDPRAEQQRLNEQAESQRVADNTKRRADVTALMVAVKSYQNKNGGAYPTAYSKGQLIGSTTPIPVQLNYYKQIAFLVGKQGPVDGDNLRLVAKANCGNAISQTVDSTSGDQVFVIQFSILSTDRTFDPQCQET